MPADSPPVRAAPRALRIASAIGFLATLGGCNGAISNTFPPACPRAGILADAADITRYRPGATGHDLTDMVLDGRIIGVSGACTRADPHELDVSVTVSMRLVRGPAAGAEGGDVGFFIAVSRHGEVLDKQVYRVAPGFAPNADTLRLTSDPVSLNLPISPAQPGSAYDLVVGFQLTPDEVAMNRRRGPR